MLEINKNESQYKFTCDICKKVKEGIGGYSERLNFLNNSHWLVILEEHGLVLYCRECSQKILKKDKI